MILISAFDFSLVAQLGHTDGDLIPIPSKLYPTLIMIWSGFGFLTGVITFGFCLLLNYVLDNQFGEGYYSSHYWTIGVALLSGGICSAAIGFSLKGSSDRFAIDEETGERLLFSSNNHTLFFIPMHWAGVAISAIGIFLIVMHALGFVPPPEPNG